MGASVQPEKVYSPDNPFAGGKQYSPDNPFAQKAAPRTPLPGQMGHPIVDASPQPNDDREVLGGIAALGHDTGTEALQAEARSFFRAHPTGKPNRLGFVPTAPDESYTEALSSIRDAENAAPKAVRIGNSLVGGTIAALAGPKGPWMNPLGRGGSAAVQAARFGAAEGALSADPMSNEDRILKAGKGGAIGAAIGGVVGDAPSKIAQITRILGGSTPGAAAIARRGAITTADEAYPTALAQGKGQTHPDVTAALDNPYIKPYVDAVRASPSNAGADDATILHKTYTRLGTRQRALQNLTEHAADFRAGPEQEIDDIEMAKKQLLAASEKIMPGYRAVVTQHAQMAEALDALKDTKDATARIMKNSNVAGQNLEKNSPEAFKANIIKMKKDEAIAAREAVLGQLHERTPGFFKPNPLKAFGLPAANSAINRVSPYLQMIQDQIGGRAPVPLQDLPVTQSSGVLRRALGIAAGAQASN